MSVFCFCWVINIIILRSKIVFFNHMFLLIVFVSVYNLIVFSIGYDMYKVLRCHPLLISVFVYLHACS